MGVDTSFFNYEDRNAALSAKAKSDSKVKSGAPNSKTAKHNIFGLRCRKALFRTQRNRPTWKKHRHQMKADQTNMM